MSKRRSHRRQQPVTVQSAQEGEFIPRQGGRAETFTFGDPMPVLDGRGILDYLECWSNGRWYEPPLSMEGLAKAVGSSVYLQSGLKFKRNMLAKTFIPHRLLSRATFEQFSLDWLTFGSAYLEQPRSRLGTRMPLQAPLARYMRRGTDLETFYQVRSWTDEHEFEKGSVIQLREADINQEIYGVPEWFCAPAECPAERVGHAVPAQVLQQRQPRRIHPLHDRRRAERRGRGCAPHGAEDRERARQLPQPVRLRTEREERGPADHSSQRGCGQGRIRLDQEYQPRRPACRAAGLSATDGVVPQNAGGFGSISDAAAVWASLELEPMQARLQQVNELIGEEIVRFAPFDAPGL